MKGLLPDSWTASFGQIFSGHLANLLRARARSRREFGYPGRGRSRFEPLESRLLLSADLVGAPTFDSDIALLVPGDIAQSTVLVQNIGTTAKKGPVEIDLYASLDDVLDASDILLDSKHQARSLRAGDSDAVELTFSFPATIQPGEYSLISLIDAENDLVEGDEANNVAVGPGFSFAWMFGDVPDHGSHEALMVRDGDGTLVRFSFFGPGTGEVSVEGGEWDVRVTGTDETSLLWVHALGGGDHRVTLDDIHVTGALGGLLAPEMDLTGTLGVEGALGAGLLIGSASGALIAAPSIEGVKILGFDVGGISILGDLENSQIMIGADLGADGRLGGAGADADSFGPGSIGFLGILGSVTASFVRAGQDPVNGVFDDCDDFIQGGAASRIGAIVIGGELSTDSRIIAGTLPALALVDGRLVPTAGDARFKTDVTGPEVELALANDTGESASDGLTFDPTVSGSALDPSGIAALQAGFDGSASVDILDELGTDGTFSLSQEDLEEVYGAPLADGSYTLTISATDGQNNTCAHVLTFTLDAAAPTVTIDQAAAQADPTNDSPILFTVEFSEPIVGFTAGDVSLAGSTFDGLLEVSVNGSGASYTVAVAGMDGVGTVVASLAAGAANDAAGNASEASTSTDNTVLFDNVAPTVTIDQAAAQEDPTNDSPILFTVEFSEPIVGFTAEDVSLAGSTVGGTLGVNVSGSGASYAVAVTGMDGVGTVVASIVAGAANDAAGNSSEASTSIDNTVLFDNVAPTVTIDQAAAQADPTNDGPIFFTVEFSEPIVGLTASDVSFMGSTVGGTLIASVAGSGASYTVSVTGMNGVGTVVASVGAGAASDAAGNSSEGSTSTDNTVLFDNVAPTVTIDQAAAQADPTNASPILFTIEFSEPIIGFTAEDVSLSGSTVGGTLLASVVGSGASYTVSVTGMNGVGTVVASVLAAGASDAAGNASEASTSTDNTVLFDNVAPTAIINQAAAQADPTNDSPVLFTVEFSEPIIGFTAEDVSLTGSTVGGTLVAGVMGSGASYTVSVTGMNGGGTVVASIPAGRASDAAGNANAASTSTDNTVLFDDVAPTVTIDQAPAQEDPSTESPIVFDVVFSEAVIGFTAGDVSIASSTAGNDLTATVTGSGANYTVSISGMDATGDVIASISAGAASDAAGNASSASTSIDNTVSFVSGPMNSAPTFAVGDGVVLSDFGGGRDVGATLGLLADGRLVVAGSGGASVFEGHFALSRYGVDGTLDPSLDGDGRVTTVVGTQSSASALAVQADGRVVVAGSSRLTSSGSTTDFAVLRYDADGTVDESFGEDGVVITDIATFQFDFAYDMAVQADGKIVVVGDTANADWAIVRYNAAGSLDTGFDGDGKLTLSFAASGDHASAVLIQPNGKILVGGTGASSDGALVRLNSDGSLDTSFSADGMMTLSGFFGSVGSLALQSDGKILAGGGSTSGFTLARLNADGSLDTSFDGDGRVITGVAPSPGSTQAVDQIVLRPDGKIWASGAYFDRTLGFTVLSVVRYNADGSLDTGFDGDGKRTLQIGEGSASAGGAALQADGRLILAGTASNGNNDDVMLLRLNPDGSFDRGFDAPVNTLDGAPIFNRGGAAVVLDSDVRVYDADLALGSSYAGASLTLARSGGASSTDVFSAKAGGTLGALTQGATLSVGGVTIGTVTTNSGGTLRLSFTSAATQALVDAALQQIAYANTSATPPATVQIGWTFNDGNSGSQGAGGAKQATGSTTVRINNLPTGTVTISGSATEGQTLTVSDTLADADGLGTIGYQWQMSSGSSWVNLASGASLVLLDAHVGRQIRAVASYTDAAGTPESVASAPTAAVVNLNAAPSFAVGDGRVTTSTNSGGNDSVLQPDGKLVVLGGSGSFSLARYNADGSLDTSFDGDGRVTTSFPSLSAAGFSVALQPDGKIVAAGRVSTGGSLPTSHIALARYNADGSLDTSFDGDGRLVSDAFADQDVEGAFDVRVQPDGGILVAGSSSPSSGASSSDFIVVRYNADGSFDQGFSGDGKLASFGGDGTANAIALQPDGKILVAGQERVGGLFGDNLFALARYHADGTLDASFSGDGLLSMDVGPNGRGEDIVVQPDGMILVVASGGSGLTVLRFNTDGSLDASFDGDGMVATSVGTGASDGQGMVLQANGRIVVAGIASNGLNNDFALVRYNADGSLDTSFDGDGRLLTDFAGANDRASSVSLQSDGRIVVSGTAVVGSSNQFGIARYNPDGSLDLAFDMQSNTLDGAPTYNQDAPAVVLDSDVRVYDVELAAQGHYGGATLTLARNSGASPEDVFSATGTLGALTQGAALTVGGTTIGTVTTNSGGTLRLTFNSAATQARVDAALQQIAYSNNTAAAPTSVQIDWTFSDANSGAQGTGGAQSATGSTTVTIAPAMVASTSAEGQLEVSLLTDDELESIADAGIAQWAGTLGLDSATVDALDAVPLVIEDLPDGLLASTDGSSIFIDIDAAGHDWFVDVTPLVNEEYEATSGGIWTALASSPAYETMDLFTVVMHELGHLLGFHHESGWTVMHDSLSAGARYAIDWNANLDWSSGETSPFAVKRSPGTNFSDFLKIA